MDDAVEVVAIALGAVAAIALVFFALRLYWLATRRLAPARRAMARAAVVAPLLTPSLYPHGIAPAAILIYTFDGWDRLMFGVLPLALGWGLLSVVIFAIDLSAYKTCSRADKPDVA